MLNTNFTIYSLHFIYELSNNDGLILTINLSAKQVRSFTLKPQGEWAGTVREENRQQVLEPKYSPSGRSCKTEL